MRSSEQEVIKHTLENRKGLLISLTTSASLQTNMFSLIPAIHKIENEIFKVLFGKSLRVEDFKGDFNVEQKHN